MMTAKPITADMLLGLLAARHSKDVFVSECKNGPTHYADGLLRFDAWAMAKSWAHPTTWAYEIKVDRGDFIRDRKWRGALDFCREFYFVAPPGIIDPAELPPEAGLLLCTTGGKRLLMKKRAPTREVMIPEELYRYILMSRCQITAPQVDRVTALETVRDWLEGKRSLRQLGHMISRKLRQRIEEEIEDVERQNYALLRRVEQAEAVEAAMRRMGYKPHEFPVWNADRVLRGLPGNLVDTAKTLRDLAEKFLRAVEQEERSLQRLPLPISESTNDEPEPGAITDGE